MLHCGLYSLRTGLCKSITGCSTIKVKWYSQVARIKDWVKQYQGGSVDLQKDEGTGIAVVTLNNAERKNAISGAMMANLTDITGELELWKTGKGVILHGEGNTFCSGGDLDMMKRNMDPASGEDMCTLMQDTLWRFFNLPLVSVALLQGHVLGAGAEIATACDFRVVTEGVTVGFVQRKMGLSPGYGGGTRLVQLMGRTRALDLLLSGRTLSWEGALMIGFANDYIDQSDSLQHTKDWLQKRINASSDVTQVMKSLVVGAVNSRVAESIANEKSLFKSVWGGPAHQKAISKAVKHK